MEKQMHLAAQYLAAAGSSFLEKKADDSHTNLGFSIENGCLYTHPLSDRGDMLCLDYEKFTLDWHSESGHTAFRLDGATHKEALKWLTEVSDTFLNKKYNYDFHYQLPYSIKDIPKFKLLHFGKVQELLHLRILAQFALERVINDHNLKGSIRVWPHHFDTAVFTNLKHGSGISVGLGLAIPDALCNEYYMYISGYKDNTIIETSDLNNLSIGEWKNDKFKGAILPAINIVEADAVGFFKEAINNYKTKSK
jgi:hypothetical protein